MSRIFGIVNCWAVGFLYFHSSTWCFCPTVLVG